MSFSVTNISMLDRFWVLPPFWTLMLLNSSLCIENKLVNRGAAFPADHSRSTVADRSTRLQRLVSQDTHLNPGGWWSQAPQPLGPCHCCLPARVTSAPVIREAIPESSGSASLSHCAWFGLSSSFHPLNYVLGQCRQLPVPASKIFPSFRTTQGLAPSHSRVLCWTTLNWVVLESH